MHNQTESITLDVIQSKCQYQNLDTLRVFWKAEHPETKFPKRDVEIIPVLLIPFLKRVATPGRGKSETVIAGATELLSLFQSDDETEQPKRLEPVNTNLPRMKNPPPPPPRKQINGNPPIIRPIETPTQTEPTIRTKRINIQSWVDCALSLNGFAWLTIISVLVTTYGCWMYFETVGLLIAVFYAIILFEAVRAARKSNGASERAWALIAVIVLESLSGFIHFGWLNIHLWGKLEKIPFSWSETTKIHQGGQIIEQTLNTTPGIIAVVFAVFISAGSFYAVLQQMNRTSDSIWD